MAVGLVGLVAGAGCARGAPVDARGPQERLLQSVFEQSAEEANSLAFDATAAACAARAVVRDLGAVRLQQLGLDVPSRQGPELTEPPLTTEEADLIYMAFVECLDLVAQLGATIGRDSGMPADVSACVASGYVESGVLREALFADELSGTLASRIDSVLADAARACKAS